MRTLIVVGCGVCALVVAACSSSSVQSSAPTAVDLSGQPTVAEIARTFASYGPVGPTPQEVSKRIADAHSDGTLKPVSFRVTPTPIMVPAATAMSCISPGPNTTASSQPGDPRPAQATYPTAPDPRIEHPDALAGLMSILVYMNEPALGNKQLTKGPFPVGAVIVKQKTNQGGTAHGGVGGMVKRPAGYDPKNGDWEYFYFDSITRISSGKMASCIDCHAGAKKTDYVFGGWLR